MCNGCTIGQRAQSPVYSFHFHTSWLLKVIGLLFRARYLFIVTFLKLETRSRTYGLQGALRHRSLAVRYCSKQDTPVHSKNGSDAGDVNKRLVLKEPFIMYVLKFKHIVA